MFACRCFFIEVLKFNQCDGSCPSWGHCGLECAHTQQIRSTDSMSASIGGLFSGFSLPWQVCAGE
jgi:hypothetical protein